MQDVVIKIEDLTKEYRLGVISHRTLYKEVQSFVSRMLDKEDPNTLVGTNGSRFQKGKFNAVDNVSLEIRRGDVVGIIGKNGAGKSTLLKILSRVTAPTRGEVFIKGRIASLLEVGTGFHPELTGKENIFLNGAILGMTRKEIKSKYEEIVDFSGIREFIDTPVKRYSSGMYVRLAFSVAAHLDADILIVDEVLAVGDVEFQKKCLGKMNEVSKSGRTILFVSHNMGAIRSFCKSVVYLHEGKIKAIGEPGPLINMYNSSFDKKNFNELTEQNNQNNRRGSGEARFSSIRLMNSRGEDTEYFYDNEDIFIEMGIKVNKPLNVLNLTLALQSPIYGENITTVPYLPLINSAKKSGELLKYTLHIKSPNIRAGHYPIFLWLGTNENQNFDTVDSIYHLNIISNRTERELGYNPDNPNGYFNLNYSLTQ